MWQIVVDGTEQRLSYVLRFFSTQFVFLRGLRSAEYQAERLEWMKGWKLMKWMGRRGLERFLKDGGDDH